MRKTRTLPAPSPRSIMRSRARTFYLASVFLPRETRDDVRTIYAYYRTVDDLVDDPPPGWDRGAILAKLQAWESSLRAGSGSELELPTELHRTVARYQIPVQHLTAVIEGARYDLDLQAVQTRAELERYAFLMAGSVGLVLARVLGATAVEALEAAAQLGIAMQLTNILRDVGEDLRRGRVYLPLEDLRVARYTLEDLQAQVMSEGLRDAIRSLATIARERYRLGLAGLLYLDASARFSIYLAARLYSRILDKIEDRDYDIFTGRVHVSGMEKWMETLPAYLHCRRLVRADDVDACEA